MTEGDECILLNLVTSDHHSNLWVLWMAKLADTSFKCILTPRMTIVNTKSEYIHSVSRTYRIVPPFQVAVHLFQQQQGEKQLIPGFNETLLQRSITFKCMYHGVNKMLSSKKPRKAEQTELNSVLSANVFLLHRTDSMYLCSSLEWLGKCYKCVR